MNPHGYGPDGIHAVMVSRQACYHRGMDKEWTKEWTEEEEAREQKFAQSVVDRSIALPTILILESLRQLHFIGGQFLHFMAPISGLVISRWDLDQLCSFLEHRNALPFVIDEIQRLEKEREAKKRQEKVAPPRPEKAASSDTERKTR